MTKYSALSSYFSPLFAKEGWILLWGLFSGICGAFAFSPWFIWPLLMPSFGGLALLIIHAQSYWVVAKRGFIWGIGFFFTGIQWMTIAIALSPDMLWLAWPTIFVFSAGLSLLFIVPSTILMFLCVGLPRLLFFALLATFFSVSTWFRGVTIHFLWNPVANIWVVSDETMQMLSMIGPYGLSFITIFAATSSSLLLWKKQVWQKRLLGFAMLPLLGSILWLYGTWRIPNISSLTYQKYEEEEVKIRLVQPGFDARIRRTSQENREHIATLIHLSRLNLDTKTQAILWPETAWPYLLQEDTLPPLGTLLAQKDQDDLLLISGILLKHHHRYYNAMGGFNQEGARFLYKKVLLVPYGEYIPFRWLIPRWIYSDQWGNLTSGDHIPVVNISGLPPFHPLICYEATFPHFIPEGERPTWILNITNDAWFGQSAGPYQHLANVRMRAVERGIPVIRAANTGVSAVIDPYGRLLKTLPLNTMGVLDTKIPSFLPPTVYARFGEIFWIGMCCATLLLSGFYFLRRRPS